MLDRTPNFPIVVDRYSDGSPLEPDVTVHLAVVVRDTSGNAHLTDLTTASIAPVDDGVEDPGLYLDPITGISAAWADETDVLVAWEHTSDPSVRAYRVYFASATFPDVESATLAAEVQASNSFRITAAAFPELTNSTGWYIAVTPVDDVFERTSVEPVFLAPLTQGEGSEGAVDDGLDLGTYLTGPNAIIAGLVLITVLLALLVLRRRGGETGKAYVAGSHLGHPRGRLWTNSNGSSTVPTAAAPPSTPSALAAPEALSVDLYAAAHDCPHAWRPSDVRLRRRIDGLQDDLGPEQHHLQPKEAWTPPSSMICCDRCAEARHRSPQVSTCLQDRVTLCSPLCCSGRNRALTSTCTLPGSKSRDALRLSPQMADALPTLRDACRDHTKEDWSALHGQRRMELRNRDRQALPEVDAITACTAMGGSHHGTKHGAWAWAAEASAKETPWAPIGAAGARAQDRRRRSTPLLLDDDGVVWAAKDEDGGVDSVTCRPRAPAAAGLPVQRGHLNERRVAQATVVLVGTLGVASVKPSTGCPSSRQVCVCSTLP